MANAMSRGQYKYGDNQPGNEPIHGFPPQASVMAVRTHGIQESFQIRIQRSKPLARFTKRGGIRRVRYEPKRVFRGRLSNLPLCQVRGSARVARSPSLCPGCLFLRAFHGLLVSQRLCRIDCRNAQSWHSGGNGRYGCEHQNHGEDGGPVIDAHSVKHAAHSSQSSCRQDQTNN